MSSSLKGHGRNGMPQLAGDATSGYLGYKCLPTHASPVIFTQFKKSRSSYRLVGSSSMAARYQCAAAVGGNWYIFTFLHATALITRICRNVLCMTLLFINMYYV